jgi:hypothetical protein
MALGDIYVIYIKIIVLYIRCITKALYRLKIKALVHIYAIYYNDCLERNNIRKSHISISNFLPADLEIF